MAGVWLVAYGQDPTMPLAWQASNVQPRLWRGKRDKRNDG